MRKILLLITVTLGVHLFAQAQEMEMISEIKQGKSRYTNFFVGYADDAYYFFASDKNGLNGKLLKYNISFQFVGEIELSEKWAKYTEAQIVDDNTFCLSYTYKVNTGGDVSSRMHIYNRKGQKTEDREYEDCDASNFTFSRDDKYFAYYEEDGDNTYLISTEDFKEVATFPNYHGNLRVEDDGTVIQMGFEQMLEEAEDDEDEEDLDEIDDPSKPFIAFNKKGEEEERISLEIEESYPHFHNYYTLKDDNKILVLYFFGDEKEKTNYYGYTYTVNSAEGVGAILINYETHEVENTYSIDFAEEEMLFQDKTESYSRFGGVEFLFLSDFEIIDNDLYIITQCPFAIEYGALGESEDNAIHGIMVKFDDEGDHKQRLLESETDGGAPVFAWPGFRLYHTGDDELKVAFAHELEKRFTMTTYTMDDELEMKSTEVEDFDGDIKYKNISLHRGLLMNKETNKYLVYGHKKKNKGFAIFILRM